MMKSAIARVGGECNSHRMVWEYVERCYWAAHRSARAASSGGVGLR